MKKLFSIFIAVLLCAVLSNLLWDASQAQNTFEIESPADSKKQEKFSRLIEKASRRGTARVIVNLKSDGQMESWTEPETEKQRRIKEKQEKFLDRHQSQRVEKLKRFKFIPFLAFEADAAALERMRYDEQVLTIEEDKLEAPTLAESTAIVGAPNAWNAGFSGSGQTIAILDTGVDKSHSFLSGRIVSEACYSSNYTNSTSLCPNGVTELVESNAGVNCASNISGCAHGTHVAGIAAGRGTSFSGVAKDANIIAIQVFSKINNAEDCGNNPVPCALSYVSDQLKALERVRVLSESMNIAAVNMSLGGGQYTGNCDAAQPSRKAMIDRLRERGIATVISSGNSGYSNAMGAPACISSAISVGSTDDGSFSTTADTVSSFSNSSPRLHLLAPGRWISSSVLNGSFSAYSGTSMAAPHVAGAFAILKQRKPDATVTQILNALVSTGQKITDSRNSLVKPRIKIDLALEAVVAPPRTPFDFDGDGKSDTGVFRPSNSVWYLQNSTNSANNFQQFGLPTDLPVPADFDGDGKTDIAVFRPANGGWYVLRSSDSQFFAVAFGALGDVPVPADYDGDGKADIAVYRPSAGGWYRLNSFDGQFNAVNFGVAEDKPVVGDYDGDGRADIAVFRPSAGSWYRLDSLNGQFFGISFGLAGDKPVPADFDGDGKTDISVYRPSNGTWYRLNSLDNSFVGAAFGTAEDLPAAADFDGDGKTDIAVFRPSNGSWYLLQSMQGFTAAQFGSNGDVPVQNSFVR